MEHQLSPAEWERVWRLLEYPPAPNDNLKALMQGLPAPITTPPHKYIADIVSGIGFCTVCYSDNEQDGNHIGVKYD